MRFHKAELFSVSFLGIAGIFLASSGCSYAQRETEPAEVQQAASSPFKAHRRWVCQNTNFYVVDRPAQFNTSMKLSSPLYTIAAGSTIWVDKQVQASDGLYYHVDGGSGIYWVKARQSVKVPCGGK